MEAQDYEQLVKALREYSGCRKGEIARITSDAAAAIEELQAEVDALKHDIKRYVRINAELHAELEKWVSAAEKAGEPKLGDMVEVVRCKDCRWRHDDSNPMWLPCNEIFPDDNWFCANGAKMEVQDEP